MLSSKELEFCAAMTTKSKVSQAHTWAKHLTRLVGYEDRSNQAERMRITTDIVDMLRLIEEDLNRQEITS